MVAAIKTLEDVRVGDTITLDLESCERRRFRDTKNQNKWFSVTFIPASSDTGSKKDRI